MGDANTSTNNREPWALFRTQWIAWIILTLSLVFTICASLISYNYLQERETNKFKVNSEKIKKAVQERIKVYNQALKSAVALIESSEEVTRDEWRRFATSINLEENWPGIQGLCYAVPVEKANLKAFEESMINQGLSDFQISPSSDRVYYTSIIYAEPSDPQNVQTLGFDMWTDPIRREAMERSRDTGQTSTSGLITSKSDSSPGFIICMPVYQDGIELTSVENRRKALKGWVFGTFRSGDLMTGILDQIKSPLDNLKSLQIYKGSVSNENLIFKSANYPDKEPYETSSISLDIYGQKWQMRLARYENIAQEEKFVPVLIATGGVVIDLFIFYVVLILTRMQKKSTETEFKLKDTSEKLVESDQARFSNEQHIKAIVDSTVDGIVTIDHMGNVQTFNKACENLFGYSKDEVIGKNVNMLMPEPYHSEHDGYIENFLKTGDAKIIGIGREVEALRKDGSTFPIDLAIGTFNDHGKPAFTGIIRDITQRKKSEEELKSLITQLTVSNDARILSEQRVQAIVDNTVDGIVTINKKGIVQSYNKACERLFGYMKDEVVGKNIKMLMPEPHHSAHDGYIDNFLKTGDAKIIGIGREVEALRKDGSTFPIDLAISSYTNESEQFFIGIMRDITERKNAQFAQDVLVEKLMSSNTDLERFAYIASHDLQEPLRMVTNFTQLLFNEYGEKLDENGKEYIKFANDSATRMYHLVAGLLEYSRVTSGDSELTKVDLHDILVLVEENLMQIIKETNAKINCKKLPKVYIEKVHAIQLFQNLISNSIKYRHKGIAPEINIYVDEDENNWILKFCDNGIGIEEKNFEKIFSPFKRLHSYSEYQGTGIGLSVCKKIMNNIGGSISVHSIPGHGSNFTVAFPKKALFNTVSTGDLNERSV